MRDRNMQLLRSITHPKTPSETTDVHDRGAESPGSMRDGKLVDV